MLAAWSNKSLQTWKCEAFKKKKKKTLQSIKLISVSL